MNPQKVRAIRDIYLMKSGLTIPKDTAGELTEPSPDMARFMKLGTATSYCAKFPGVFDAPCVLSDVDIELLPLEGSSKDLEDQLRRYQWNENELILERQEQTYHTEILMAHPDLTNDHATYEEALKLVGERHGKYELVDLVNWLLARAKKAETHITANLNE